jgi:hypothetical protein
VRDQRQAKSLRFRDDYCQEEVGVGTEEGNMEEWEVEEGGECYVAKFGAA